METELVRIYTERVTAEETTVPGVSTLDGTVKAQRNNQTISTFRDSLCSVKSVIHKRICANTGYVPTQ